VKLVFILARFSTAPASTQQKILLLILLRARAENIIEVVQITTKQQDQKQNDKHEGELTHTQEKATNAPSAHNPVNEAQIGEEAKNNKTS